MRGPARGIGPPLSRSEAERFAAQVEQALYASKAIASDQGFTMIRDAAATCDRDVNLGAVAGIWRAGCIIRAAFLGRIRGADAADPGQVGLLAWPDSKLMHAGRIGHPALLSDGHVNVAPSVIDAGFDRVGLHGANGCLIHQLGTPRPEPAPVKRPGT
nr:hypothetical protein [Streptomyces sp. SID2563]